MEKRQAFFGILVGTNGTGKTTQLQKLLKVNERNLVLPSGPYDPAWSGYKTLKDRIEYGPNVLDPKKTVTIPVIEGMGSFTGTRLVNVTNRAIFFDAVIDTNTGFRDGGLFMDDYRNYVLSKGTLRGAVSELFRARRHKRLDIFMACHGWEDVSRDLIAFNPTFFVFRTTLPPSQASVDKMANRDEFMKCIDRVNRITQSNPYYFERFQPA